MLFKQLPFFFALVSSAYGQNISAGRFFNRKTPLSLFYRQKNATCSKVCFGVNWQPLPKCLFGNRYLCRKGLEVIFHQN